LSRLAASRLLSCGSGVTPTTLRSNTSTAIPAALERSKRLSLYPDGHMQLTGCMQSNVRVLCSSRCLVIVAVRHGRSPVMVVDAAPQLPAMVAFDALLVSLQGSSIHCVRQ
jgi:hypothetical protein